MDISETSDTSSHENLESIQVLRLSNPISSEHLDNDTFDNTLNDNAMLSNKNTTLSTTATNCHPLMMSPSSPISPDFPDLIPEKAKLKHFNNEKYLKSLNTFKSENKSTEGVKVDFQIGKYEEPIAGSFLDMYCKIK